MGRIQILKNDITKMNTDVIVNAANSGLREGGGVCGAIFRAAGSKELAGYCRKIGYCDVGNAVITPGCRLNAKYVIHAVGPQWIDGKHGEDSLLYNAYKHSLELAKENNCHSIAFPLVSAGIFGCPVSTSWRKSLQACTTFFEKNPNYEMNVFFAVLDDHIRDKGEKILEEIFQQSFDALLTEELDRTACIFFLKNLNLLKAITADDTLSKWYKNYSVYTVYPGYEGYNAFIQREFFNKAYDKGLIIAQYRKIIDDTHLDETMVMNPTPQWASGLSKIQLLACFAAQFRADHFCEGSLRSRSIGDGRILPLMEAYLNKSGYGETV